MAGVIIMASVFKASVTYDKCYLWQSYYGKCNYGKFIMANVTESCILMSEELKMADSKMVKLW